MIVKMNRIDVYMMGPDREELIRGLMERGTVQIDRPESRSGYDEISGMVAAGPDELYGLEQTASRLSMAVSALIPYQKKAGLFPKKREVTFSELADGSSIAEAEIIAEAAETETRRIADCKAEISRIQAARMSLEPWISLDIPLELTGTGTGSLFYFAVPAGAATEEMPAEIAGACPASVCSTVNRDSDFAYLAVFAHRDETENLLEQMKLYSGTRIVFGGMTGLAAERIVSLEAEENEFRGEIENAKERLTGLAEQLDVLKLGCDCAAMRMEAARTGTKLVETDKTAAFTGWIAEPERESVAEFLDSMECYYEFSEPEEGEEPPVLLKNGPFTRQFESITAMYSPPAPSGIDPNFMVAPFFCIFFGMMLSDAGYGLILLAGGLLAPRLIQMGKGGKQFMNMVALCGVSTVIWGAIYGGWFGNMISVVAETWFGKTVTIPALIDPLTEPVTILIMSFAFGAIHLFCGMGVKFYLLCKRGHVWSAIFDIGSWYLVLVGLPAMLLGGVAGKIGMYAAIVGGATLILTQGRAEKNIIKRLLKGLLSLYDITGYMSDVLSYSRILALGMATGVIAQVVNTIGTLFGSGFLSAIIFVGVFIFGHLLNLAINALGAYVHSSRLQYVEFFGKFYESGGKPFSPLKAKTKYTFLT